MRIEKVDDDRKMDFVELLLLADEHVNMIEKYLYRGEMFALYDDDVKAVCVVTKEEDGVYELKNIAVLPQCQRQGYGQRLIAFVCEQYKDFGETLYVGTGCTPAILDFYHRCGFAPSHTVKNFFVDNYDHPMYEDGRQLVDMIYLKKDL